ncbi:MAG: YjbQ family protein [Nitrospirae bacterium]|nr:MAG: YjbQ family protein [Nitrospirota bacterium]
MAHHGAEIEVATRGAGLYEITGQVDAVVAASGVDSGVCCLTVLHTSCSLLCQENADPTVQADLDRFFRRLVPEGDPLFRHTLEGPDDMPAHVKAALTATCLTLPVRRGRLALGTWQGLFLFEHRRRPHRRRVAVDLLA